VGRRKEPKSSLNIEKHPLEGRLEKHLDMLKFERRLQPKSVELYQLELGLLLRLLPNPSNLDVLKKHLKSMEPTTVHRKLVMWNSFLSECDAPWKNCLSEIRAPKLRKLEPVFLTEEESFRLEQVCFRTQPQVRNRLFVMLALRLGLRVSEILALKYSDVEEKWLRIQRKGGKVQRLPLSQSLSSLFNQWRIENISSADDFVFFGKDRREALSSRSAQHLVSRLRVLAKIEKAITPHSLRHTFATNLAAKGANLAALKEILGHERLTTTERYLHVTPQHLVETLGL